MTEPMLVEARLHVERVVRPVRASWRHRLQMRQDLLNRLVQEFERARLTARDDEGAFRQAKDSIGPIEQVTGGLQGSVPWYERLYALAPDFLALRLGQLSGPEAFRQALQVTLRVTVPPILLITVAFVGLLAIFHRMVSLPSALLMFAAIGGVFVYALGVGCCAVLLAHYLWKALYGRAGPSWAHAFLSLAGCALLGLSADIGLGFVTGIEPVPGRAPGPLAMFPACTIMVPFLITLFLRVLRPASDGSLQARLVRTASREVALAVALGAMALAARYLISGNLEPSVRDASLLIVAALCWSLPVTLITSLPTVASQVRCYLEWESLSLEPGETGASRL